MTTVLVPPSRGAELETPPEPPDGRPLLFGLLFWFGLAAGVEMWWLGTPPGSVATTGDALTAVGRLTGMVSGYVLLTQVLLMSRLGWLERGVGPQLLLRWHRRLAAVLTVVVLSHVATTIVGYASVLDTSPVVQTWDMLTGYEDMLNAFLATGLLLVVGLLAIRAVRRALPYELWRVLHLGGYLVVVLGYGHQFSNGQELSHGGFGWWYWAGLHVAVLGCVVWGRLLRPVGINLRHRLRVAGVVAEADHTVSVYVTGRRLDRIAARGGQFFRWRFLTLGGWWQSHPFSLSAAPNGRWLRLTVRAVGRHTASLRLLRAGTRVMVHGPSGVFTATQRRRARSLLIAWGSGIAPIRALLEELPVNAVVIYRARSEADLVFRAELDELAHRRGTRVRYVLGSRDHPGPRRMATPDGLRDLVPDVRRRDVYLCGPAEAVREVTDALRRLRVPKRQIHLDGFEF